VDARQNMVGLKWARGTFPTPNGIAEVSVESGAKGRRRVKVRAPRDIEVVREA